MYNDFNKNFVCLQKGKVMGGARRGPEMLLKDDGWGWLMFGLGEVESGLDVMKYGVGCMKRGARVLKEKDEK